jgi:hypothetical protein
MNNIIDFNNNMSICSDFDFDNLNCKNKELCEYSFDSSLPQILNINNIVYEQQDHDIDESKIYTYDNNKSLKTNQNININDKIFRRKDEIVTKEKPKYNLEAIKECLSKNISPFEFNLINENMNYDKKIEEAINNLYFSKKKRRRTNEEDSPKMYNNNLDDKKEKNKRGRKPKNTASLLKGHDKYSDDNMIKKIKSKLFEYSGRFLNKMLEKYNEKGKNVLMQLDYKKYIDRLNREQDLKFLNMSLKDLFSNDISFKCQLK